MAILDNPVWTEPVEERNLKLSRRKTETSALDNDGYALQAGHINNAYAAPTKEDFAKERNYEGLRNMFSQSRDRDRERNDELLRRAGYKAKAVLSTTRGLNVRKIFTNFR